jgi:hypothetical protein
VNRTITANVLVVKWEVVQVAVEHDSVEEILEQECCDWCIFEKSDCGSRVSLPLTESLS